MTARPSWFKMPLCYKPLFDGLQDESAGRVLKCLLDLFDSQTEPQGLTEAEALAFNALRKCVDDAYSAYSQKVTARKRKHPHQEQEGEQKEKQEQEGEGEGEQKEKIDTSPQSPPKGDAERDALFDDFWNLYPKKADRKKAQVAFSKISAQDIPAAMAGLSRAKCSDQWTRDGGRYIPFPSTWLDGRRWEDEPTTSATKPDHGYDEHTFTQSEYDALFVNLDEDDAENMP